MIDSVNNEKIIFYKKLREKKYILENNMFIVEGAHLVEEAYKSGRLLEVIMDNTCNIIYDVKTTLVSKKCIKKISLLKSVPNIMGVVKLVKNENIIGNKIVLLDNVQDPGNVGTIIRSALAFNVSTIVMSPESVNIYNDKLIRSTEGTIFNMNIVVMPLSEAIEKIHEMGIKVYYADMYGSINLDDADIKDYALVLGSEGKGISKLTKDKCDVMIKIPMKGKVNSLNASVAGGILMYEIMKQRI